MSGSDGPSHPVPEVWPPGPPSPPRRNRLPLAIGGLAVLVVGGLVMLALVASGDDNSPETGNGGASNDPGGASTRSEGMTIPTAPGGGGISSETTDPAAEVSPLAGVDPCSMLSDEQVAGLGSGAEAPEPDEVGRARTCGWRVRNATGDLGTDDATVLVAIYDDLGMQDMTPPSTWETTPLPPIGTHEAEQKDADGSCFIALSVTDSAHVETTVTGNPGGDLCGIAVRVAEMVEPGLP